MASPPLGPYPTAAALESSFRELLLGVGATSLVLGCSREGRPLTAYSLGAAGAPVVLLTALMHGSEVIGALALRRWLEDSLQGGAFSGLRLWVVPVVNPDALHHNMRRLAAGGAAFQRGNGGGVDLNRNFSWLGDVRHPMGGSNHPWSPHFRGSTPFSEPESRALRDLVLREPPVLSLAFHSFGEVLLYPWSHRLDPHPRRADYERLGAALNRGMSGRPYKVKAGATWYPICGDFDDYLDNEFGTLAMTLEVGCLDRRLLHPLRLLNPFWWMNPLDVESTVVPLSSGLSALLAEARRSVLKEARSSRGHSSRANLSSFDGIATKRVL
ncbi:MAG: M14 family zinc carboxypeptidase [Myxococcales bacterium]|nr:M14 family zinc carboxypeptidase [Polyangiaceae bacterium]MDW8249409.1 M14 family zinc carboxypeptidase [Myxococcales bacterium]